ncbi:MAG: Dabb family protein [Proteobacteria bacterium]|nr:Dabb family protein [Pseudomonadota bacterium]
MRVVSMLHVRDGLDDARHAEIEGAVARAADEVAEVRGSHLGRHFPGAVGGGQYTWDVLLEGRDPGALLRAPSLGALTADGALRLDTVAFETQHREVPEPGLRDFVKRTLFLRVLPGTPPEAVERFERDTRGMPQYIDAIRNWAFSRTDPSLCSTSWTHVWEQEFQRLDGLEQDYMLSPYHWGLVDGWFDPECPQRIVDTRLAHVYCPAPSTILGWGDA